MFVAIEEPWEAIQNAALSCALIGVCVAKEIEICIACGGYSLLSLTTVFFSSMFMLNAISIPLEHLASIELLNFACLLERMCDDDDNNNDDE